MGKKSSQLLLKFLAITIAATSAIAIFGSPAVAAVPKGCYATHVEFDEWQWYSGMGWSYCPSGAGVYHLVILECKRDSPINAVYNKWGPRVKPGKYSYAYCDSGDIAIKSHLSYY